MASSAVGKASPFPAIPRNCLPPEPGFSSKFLSAFLLPGRFLQSFRPLKAENNLILIYFWANSVGNGEYRPKFSDKKLKEVELLKKIPELQEEAATKPAGGRRAIWEMIKEVKAMLSSMGDGEITSSAYDTAWVAMVPGTGGSGPRFPSSLQWIIDNQLDDGSWGDQGLFSAHDRIISTLACVVALRFWNLYRDQCQKGLLFLKENMRRLAEEDEELMPIGFEVALPSLMDLAKGLGLDCPYDDPSLQYICAKREIKLKRIPRELMHKVPTTLLHSLEGMPGLEWQSLLKLQSSDGSFLFSPSSTAYALMQTGDENCLRYLKKVVDRFHGGVPNVYPVDLFEHLWVVDRLQRLGISRYFEAEIKQCMDYIFKYNIGANMGYVGRGAQKCVILMTRPWRFGSCDSMDTAFLLWIYASTYSVFPLLLSRFLVWLGHVGIREANGRERLELHL
ncbi:Ent-copalyl diphosphate synthase, chloroplastic [Dendrobium catenatum]|uniref:Ent-copalyl diphosphate synthase, chloroplastic n=1 Tax=Dendrobium catenatum TaxID=906689 RepID=A0A2I0VWL0_9ASPA|nr:Ent-copalyl diphosphate synthase, chloroplastic [Dendrobium catenatum]